MNASTNPTRPPGVMVSSTFYDLRHVRADLLRFISDELGYRALVSEHPSFPIDPDLSTIENCRKRVQEDADVLILLIGRRYGTEDPRTATSVTNLEYLTARAMRIPIYAFTERGLLTLLPVWRRDPNAVAGEVDTPKLFEFLDTVRRVDAVWSQEFDGATDIIDALRIQFAYQHRRGLQALARMRPAGDEEWLNELRGDTLRIALERGEAWETRLIASALRDAVNRSRRLRNRHRLELRLGPGEDIHEPFRWIQARFSDAQRLAQIVETLLNRALPVAMRDPGIPANAEELVFVADSIGDVYGDALRWHARISTANVDEGFRRIYRITARFVDDLIRQIEGFGPYIDSQLDRALAKRASGEPAEAIVELKIAVDPQTLAEFHAEMARLRER